MCSPLIQNNLSRSTTAPPLFILFNEKDFKSDFLSKISVVLPSPGFHPSKAMKLFNPDGKYPFLT
jgi:hypothetical protein